MDQQGCYLAHPDPAKRWGGPKDLDIQGGLWNDAPHQAAAILSGQPGHVRVGDEVWVYRPVYPSPEENPGHFWVIIRREPAQHIYASITSFRLVAGGVLAVAILLSVLMSAGIARNINQPVLALRQAVERFGQGDLDIQVPVQSENEIAALTQAFNHMAAAIRRDVTLLQRLNHYAIRVAHQRQMSQALQLTAQTAAALCPQGWAGVYTQEDGQLRAGQRRGTAPRAAPTPPASPRQPCRTARPPTRCRGSLVARRTLDPRCHASLLQPHCGLHEPGRGRPGPQRPAGLSGAHRRSPRPGPDQSLAPTTEHS